MQASQIRAIVRGKVQGVYFRASTRDLAQRLDLGGYARNLPDGSVEVVAEGAEDQLRSLLDYLQHGPDLARVTDVTWEPVAGLDAPRPFGVR